MLVVVCELLVVLEVLVVDNFFLFGGYLLLVICLCLCLCEMVGVYL